VRELGVMYGINHSLCGSGLAGRRRVADGTKVSERMTDLGNASSVDVLRGMTTDDQKMLAHIAKRRRLRAGDFVYIQGDPAQHFYIVESGRVRVFYQTPAGREPTVTYRGPGNLFGISHLAESGRRVTSAQVLEPSAIWAIANEDLDEVTRRLPALASAIIKSLSSRLRDVMVLVESVATWPSRLRVANFLLANRERQQGVGATAGEGWTHERIADRLGCARQTVTEALNEFARKGWIRVQRKRVSVMDRDALERLVNTEFTMTQAHPGKARAVSKEYLSGR
jgi:CRP/FNR family transcriptional regulator, cyclic AMP receptor protein